MEEQESKWYVALVTRQDESQQWEIFEAENMAEAHRFVGHYDLSEDDFDYEFWKGKSIVEQGFCLNLPPRSITIIELTEHESEFNIDSWFEFQAAKDREMIKARKAQND